MPRLGRMNHCHHWIVTVALVLALVSSVATSAHAADSNDALGNAIVLVGTTNITASNAGASAEPGEPAHADEPATHSLWWLWTAPATRTYSISTSNSAFDTVLGVYTGNTLSNLSAVASNDDNDVGQLWSRVVFRAYAGETFRIAVDGSGGATGSVRLSIGTIIPLMAPWQVYTTTGSSIHSTNFEGQVLLVDFWETTCGACVQEMPDLSDLHLYFRPQGFSVIGLSIDPSATAIDDFLRKQPVSYPIARSDPGIEHTMGGTVGMPTKYLVDRERRIVGRYLGGHELPFYENIVIPLLRPPPNVRVVITRSGGALKLSWPAAETGYEVQSASELPGASWIKVDAPVETLNGRNVVSIPLGVDTRFFRLQKL